MATLVPFSNQTPDYMSLMSSAGVRHCQTSVVSVSMSGTQIELQSYCYIYIYIYIVLWLLLRMLATEPREHIMTAELF